MKPYYWSYDTGLVTDSLAYAKFDTKEWLKAQLRNYGISAYDIELQFAVRDSFLLIVPILDTNGNLHPEFDKRKRWCNNLFCMELNASATAFEGWLVGYDNFEEDGNE
jgi:hypothetical protein